MFTIGKVIAASRINHSSNVDELMEAFMDDASPSAKTVTPSYTGDAIASQPSHQAIRPTAVGASGAIAAEISS